MKYGLGEKEIEAFCNDDARLREKAANVLDERSAAGLDGLTGGLDHVIINVEPERLQAAAEEWIRYSGFSVSGGFENDEARTLVLKAPNSADVLIRTRLRGANPFESVNRAPKSAHLPNTRVETFVFETSDIDAYVEIQRGRGVRFLSDSPLRTEHCAFIQTAPSPYTGNSIGVIQWIGDRGRYEGIGDSVFDARVVPPRGAHTDNIGLLDHAATRVVAVNRDPAIIEFMWLTNYRFEFALHIAELNSITSVTRLPGADFAMVFTSGIRRADGMEGDGPTE